MRLGGWSDNMAIFECWFCHFKKVKAKQLLLGWPSPNSSNSFHPKDESQEWNDFIRSNWIERRRRRGGRRRRRRTTCSWNLLPVVCSVSSKEDLGNQKALMKPNLIIFDAKTTSLLGRKIRWRRSYTRSEWSRWTDYSFHLPSGPVIMIYLVFWWGFEGNDLSDGLVSLPAPPCGEEQEARFWSFMKDCSESGSLDNVGDIELVETKQQRPQVCLCFSTPMSLEIKIHPCIPHCSLVSGVAKPCEAKLGNSEDTICEVDLIKELHFFPLFCMFLEPFVKDLILMGFNMF